MDKRREKGIYFLSIINSIYNIKSNSIFLYITQLNVILVSSEHAFPYGLQDPQINFNLGDFNGYIYAGEVPPKDMYDLLTVKWGIEPNVAIALISIYGGHIYDMKEALFRLCEQKERFRQFLDSNRSNNVLKCLKWK